MSGAKENLEKSEKLTQAQQEGWFPEEYGPAVAPVTGDEYVAVDTSEDQVMFLAAQVAQMKANLGK